MDNYADFPNFKFIEFDKTSPLIISCESAVYSKTLRFDLCMELHGFVFTLAALSCWGYLFSEHKARLLFYFKTSS